MIELTNKDSGYKIIVNIEDCIFEQTSNNGCRFTMSKDAGSSWTEIMETYSEVKEKLKKGGLL